jgi:hypothetical protein
VQGLANRQGLRPTSARGIRMRNSLHYAYRHLSASLLFLSCGSSGHREERSTVDIPRSSIPEPHVAGIRGQANSPPNTNPANLDPSIAAAAAHCTRLQAFHSTVRLEESLGSPSGANWGANYHVRFCFGKSDHPLLVGIPQFHRCALQAVPEPKRNCMTKGRLLIITSR